MSTKGASNRYGKARYGRQGRPNKHIGYAWAKKFKESTLADHFRRHGAQLGCTSKESYAAHAVKFANMIDRKDCVSFVAKNGRTFKYNKSKNILSITTKSGIVVTYFKPKEGYKYYLTQIKDKRKGRRK